MSLSCAKKLGVEFSMRARAEGRLSGCRRRSEEMRDFVFPVNRNASDGSRFGGNGFLKTLRPKKAQVIPPQVLEVASELSACSSRPVYNSFSSVRFLKSFSFFRLSVSRFYLSTDDRPAVCRSRHTARTVNDRSCRFDADRRRGASPLPLRSGTAITELKAPP